MSNRLKPVSGTPAAAGRRVALSAPTDLPAELARLSCLSVDDLKSAWTEIIGGAAPKNARRDYLLRAITHDLQCKSYGGIPKILHRSLMKVADEEKGKGIEGAMRTRSLKLGARIYREWKGAAHEVEVIEGGYRYEGATFKSLSVIARKITGTRWSGPAFFGLKNAAERERNA